MGRGGSLAATLPTPRAAIPFRQPRADGELASLREALSVLADRLVVGFAVAEPTGAILFATPRAERLLGPQGRLVLPGELLMLVQAVLGETHDQATTTLKLSGSHHPVKVKGSVLSGTPRHLLLSLEEEAPRGTVSQRLVELYGLSARSIQLVQLASRGLKNREIGARMRLSESSVKTYMHEVFRSLGVRNRAELVALAERLARD